MFQRDTFKRDLNEDLTDTRFSCFLTNFASVTMDLRQSSCQNAPWSKIHFQVTSNNSNGKQYFHDYFLNNRILTCELTTLYSIIHRPSTGKLEIN